MTVNKMECELREHQGLCLTARRLISCLIIIKYQCKWPNTQERRKKDAFWRQDHKSSLSSSFSCNRHTSLPHLKCIISQERLGVAESMPSKLKRHIKIPTTPSKRNDLFMSNSQRYITYHCLWLDFALQSDGVKVCLCVTWVRAQSLSLTKKNLRKADRNTGLLSVVWRSLGDDASWLSSLIWIDTLPKNHSFCKQES